MAHKNIVATREFRYKTRMLAAGDPLTVSGPQARVYEALGWASPDEKHVRRARRAAKPKAKAAAPEPAEELITEVPAAEETAAEEPAASAPLPHTLAPAADEELATLRVEYSKLAGKRPGFRWNAEELRAHIADLAKKA